MKLKLRSRTLIADTVTPVAAFLRLRDRFPGCLLLEGNDYQPGKNQLSYLCIGPLRTFSVSQGKIEVTDPRGEVLQYPDQTPAEIRQALVDFTSSFECVAETPIPYESGLFGYSSYDAVGYFEDIELKQPSKTVSHLRGQHIPEIFYQMFRFVLVFNPYKNELTVIEHVPIFPENSPGPRAPHSVRAAAVDDCSIEDLLNLVQSGDYPVYRFHRRGEQRSNFSEEEFLECIRQSKKHIQRGDVFQIVPSRRYEQDYTGDDFAVYRALRSINPSPYLFYCDYGSFRLFGSSPEAQLVIRNGKASLFPIAGTYRRSGDEEEDQAAIQRLLKDEKENAEHVMLVDLARNDLSRHCYPVEVEAYRSIEQYSHVIHLTSKVSGAIESTAGSLALFFDTFPMGTLTGAPKYRAMEIIDQLENGPRLTYGGAVGMIGFQGTLNHAIVIRSFLSAHQVLTFQAGCGVVTDSRAESEAEEVRNKLLALQRALEMAETFS